MHFDIVGDSPSEDTPNVNQSLFELVIAKNKHLTDYLYLKLEKMNTAWILNAFDVDNICDFLSQISKISTDFSDFGIGPVHRKHQSPNQKPIALIYKIEYRKGTNCICSLVEQYWAKYSQTWTRDFKSWGHMAILSQNLGAIWKI